MSEVTIAVRGENERRLLPERATVRVTVRAEGPERSAAVEEVSRLTEPVRSSIAERRESGGVVEWTSKNMTVRAERPWNNEGRRLAPVYYANVDVTATFAAAADLSAWVSEISAWDGVEVGWVDWHLTPETSAQVEREVASAAVGVAVARAQAYASALGLSDVVPVEIADAGLISTSSGPTPPAMKARSVAFAADAAPTMQYEPEDIVVSATVEARFLAR